MSNGRGFQLSVCKKEMATATNSSKKQRESYTLEFKLKILDEVDKKRKKADICSQFSLPKSTLCWTETKMCQISSVW